MTDSETLQAALSVLRKQEAKGERTYGRTLDHFAGSSVEMACHAKEEAADTLMYLVTLERLVAKLEAENAELRAKLNVRIFDLANHKRYPVLAQKYFEQTGIQFVVMDYRVEPPIAHKAETYKKALETVGKLVLTPENDAVMVLHD